MYRNVKVEYLSLNLKVKARWLKRGPLKTHYFSMWNASGRLYARKNVNKKLLSNTVLSNAGVAKIDGVIVSWLFWKENHLYVDMVDYKTQTLNWNATFKDPVLY